jgi:uncharacterized protein YoxC
MQYQVNVIVNVEKKSTLLKKVIRLVSETPLSVKQIKDQCFVKLDLDENKYTKKSEEIWQRGVSLDEANSDTEVFDKTYQKNPEYLLVLKEK